LRLGIPPRSASLHGQPRSVAARGLAFLWFTVASFWVALRKTQPGSIFAVLQPLTVALPILLLGRIKRAGVVFNVQDLHPDALVALGVIRRRWVISLLRRLERMAYRHANGLAVISEGFRQHCLARGARPESVRVIPNWIDLDEVKPLERSSVLGSQLHLEPGAFVALYAGTIGLVSGAEVVIEAADLLRDSGIHFAFVGEGPLVPRLVEETRRRRLRNVSFLPFQPRERVGEVQSLGDVSLVTLREGHGKTSVPSKVLGYLAAAKPIVAAIEADCETARFLRESGAGLIVPPSDPAGLADAILRLRGDPAAARDLGRAGRRFMEEQFAKPTILELHEALLHEVVMDLR
jgi:colanic acid biosynthesis glycosyl transferase WcaI